MCVHVCRACVCVCLCVHVCMWVGCVCGFEIHRYDHINKLIQKHSNNFILVLWIQVYCLVCGLSHWRQLIVDVLHDPYTTAYVIASSVFFIVPNEML